MSTEENKTKPECIEPKEIRIHESKDLLMKTISELSFELDKVVALLKDQAQTAGRMSAEIVELKAKLTEKPLDLEQDSPVG